MGRYRYKFSFVEIAILIMMFAASMNIFSGYFYCVFLAFGIIFFTNNNFRIDSTTLVLLIISILYVIIHPDFQGSFTAAIKAFSYPLCYLLGLNFMNFNSAGEKEDVTKSNNRKMLLSILSVAVGSFVHYFLNMMRNGGGATNRNTIDIWTGQSTAATGQSALAAMMLGVCIALLFSSVSFKWKMTSIIAIFVIFAYNLVLGGRTLIVIALFLIIAALIFSSFHKKSSLSLFVQSLGLVLIVGIAFFILDDNVLGIRDVIRNSNLGIRFQDDFLIDERLELKRKYINLLSEYPLGGDHIHNRLQAYAHDIVLDTYNDVGIAGVIVLMCFLITSVKECICTLKNKEFSPMVRLVVLCVHIAIWIVFMLEPIIAGMPWLFCSYCYFSGMLVASNRTYRKCSILYENFAN